MKVAACIQFIVEKFLLCCKVCEYCPSEENPEEEVMSLKGSSAPKESADTMGAPNLNPEESPEVEGVLNTSQVW